MFGNGFARAAEPVGKILVQSAQRGYIVMCPRQHVPKTKSDRRPQRLAEILPGGRGCMSSRQCPVVACRVGSCSWWCFGRLARPAGASHGICSWWCFRRTSVLLVLHTEHTFSGGASDGCKILPVLHTDHCVCPLRCCRRNTRPGTARSWYCNESS